MYEDLDDFFKHLSQRSQLDIIAGYKCAIKSAIGYYYFIDEEAKLFCALIKGEGKYLTLRLEGEGHNLTMGAVRKMKALLSRETKEEGLPIEAWTHKDFWNDKVEQLLRILRFGPAERKGDFFIATYKGE